MTNNRVDESSCFALLEFTGDDLNPDKLSNLLSITPYFSKRKGDILGNRSDAPTPRARTGICIFSSDRNIISNDINDHIMHLINQICTNLINIKSIMNEENILWRIVCFFENYPEDIKRMLNNYIKEKIKTLGIDVVLAEEGNIDIIEDKY